MAVNEYLGHGLIRVLRVDKEIAGNAGNQGKENSERSKMRDSG